MSGSGRIICITSWHHTHTYTHTYTYAQTHISSREVWKSFFSFIDWIKKKHQLRAIVFQTKHPLVIVSRGRYSHSLVGMFGIPITVAGFVEGKTSSAERWARGFTVETPSKTSFLGGQRGPIIPTKIKVCGEPSWGVRESLFQIRVQTDERFRRLSHTYMHTHLHTHKHTQIQLHVYII